MTEEQRTAWIDTVQAMSGTDRQRWAFLDGYNRYGPPPHSSRQMLERHALGMHVHSILHPEGAPDGRAS